MDIQKEEKFEALPEIEMMLRENPDIKFENGGYVYHGLNQLTALAVCYVAGAWMAWQAAKANAVPAKLVLELEKGRFKEYEFKALLCQSLRASKVTRSKLNWVHVMGMIGTGSTVAYRICEALGVNPDGTEFKA